jgi:hypothetical protein
VLDAEIDRSQIDVPDVLPVLLLKLYQGAEDRGRRVVHQDIELPKLTLNYREHLGDFVGVGDVRLEHERAPSKLRELLGDGLGLGASAVAPMIDNDISAAPPKL